MHHPGALELATLVILVALAVDGLALARNRPLLRPVAAGLTLLASIELARLWTHGSAIDKVLFVAWAGVTVAPSLAVLEMVTRSREAGPQAHHASEDDAQGLAEQPPSSWGAWTPWARAGGVVLTFVLLGVLVAALGPTFRASALLPFWPVMLGSTRVLATLVTGYALAERVLRAGGRWLPFAREEQAALVLPAAQLADLVSVWALGGRWWVARILAIAAYIALGVMLRACPPPATTPRSSASGS